MEVSACCVIEGFALSLVCTVSNPDEAVESLLLSCQHCRRLLAALEATVLQRFSSGRSDRAVSVSYHTIHPFCGLHSVFLITLTGWKGLASIFFCYCSLILNNWKYEVILQCRIFRLYGTCTMKTAFILFYKNNLVLQRLL